MAPASLKRGRSWLEIGVVGCSLLLWRAQAGTATRMGPPVNAATPALPSIVEKNASVPPNDGLTRLFPRRLHDDANLYAAVGAWSECDLRTCTQSRPVMCETSDFKIVRNELCGDVLPEGVRACADEHGASACPPVDGVGSAKIVASGPTHGSNPPSGGRKSAGFPPGRFPTVSGAGDGLAPEDADSSPSELEHRAKEARGSRTRGSASRVGSPQASEAGAGGVTTRDAGELESKAEGILSAESESRLSEGAAAAVPAGGEKQGVGGGKAREGEKSSANGEALGSTPVQDKPGGDYAASRSAGEPNFAAQKMERIGGGGGAAIGGSRDRFWTVIAVGAGAVGSFLAVAVFAIQLYRKEQHRHRGIMALNDFPQDNYINPFATHLAEEDRTAFQL